MLMLNISERLVPLHSTTSEASKLAVELLINHTEDKKHVRCMTLFTGAEKWLG